MNEEWPGQYQGRIRYEGDRTRFYEVSRAFNTKADWLLEKAAAHDPYESFESRAVYAQRGARWLRAAGKAYRMDLEMKGRRKERS